jgi:hypothetical protein
VAKGPAPETLAIASTTSLTRKSTCACQCRSTDALCCPLQICLTASEAHQGLCGALGSEILTGAGANFFDAFRLRAISGRKAVKRCLALEIQGSPETLILRAELIAALLEDVRCFKEFCADHKNVSKQSRPFPEPSALYRDSLFFFQILLPPSSFFSFLLLILLLLLIIIIIIIMLLMQPRISGCSYLTFLHAFVNSSSLGIASSSTLL